LFNFFPQVGQSEAYFVAINGNSVSARHISKDSLISLKEFLISDSTVFASLLPGNLKQFLYGECENTVSSHKRSVLVIADSKHKSMVEFDSFDGKVSETLSKGNNFPYLNVAYNFIRDTFGDLE
jgi:hypothetical protein